MPTPYRRLHVTLTPELETVLGDLSALTGKGQATILREFLVGALPGLQAFAGALRDLQGGKRDQVVEQMLGTLDQAVSEGRQLSLAMKQKRRRRKRVP